MNKFIVSLLGLACASALLAQTTPSWRGQTNTTYQYWDFYGVGDLSTSQIVPPNDKINPYGQPIAAVVTGAYGLGWFTGDTSPMMMNLLGSQNKGFWDLGVGTTNTGLMNLICPGPTNKSSWRAVVQVIFYYDSWTYATPPAVTITGATLAGTDRVTLGGCTWGQWNLMTWTFTASNHCRNVVVTAPATGALIDRVSVDTMLDSPPLPPQLPPLVLSFDGENNVRYMLISSSDMVKWETNCTWTGLFRKAWPIFQSNMDVPKVYRVVILP